LHMTSGKKSPIRRMGEEHNNTNHYTQFFI